MLGRHKRLQPDRFRQADRELIQLMDLVARPSATTHKRVQGRLDQLARIAFAPRLRQGGDAPNLVHSVEVRLGEAGRDGRAMPLQRER